MESYKDSGFPEIKWFFRKTDTLTMPTDPKEARKALKQWEEVLAFRQRMQDFNDPVFYTEYPGSDGFTDVFDQDLSLWLADSARPWVSEHNNNSTSTISATDNNHQAGLLPPDFDLETYRKALIERFDNLNFEMLLRIITH
jgi:hypothetical protein